MYLYGNLEIGSHVTEWKKGEHNYIDDDIRIKYGCRDFEWEMESVRERHKERGREWEWEREKNMNMKFWDIRSGNPA